MVYASTLILATAALAVAPALAAPAGHQTHKAHVPAVSAVHAHAKASAGPPASAELDAREPNPFNFKKAFRGVARVAKSVGGVALKAAPLLLREVEDLDELNARELEDLLEREPHPFNFKKAFRGVARVAGKVGGIALKAAPLLLRGEDGNIYDARDFEELEEIDAREPNPFNFKKAFRGVARVAKTVGGVALKAAPLLLREVDDFDDLDARDFLDESDDGLIFIRDVDGELYVLDAREPRFNLKHTLHKVSHVARKAVGVANKVMGVAGQLGLRELDGEEEMSEAREYEPSLDELD